jgi:chromosome segregation ATPase
LDLDGSSYFQAMKAVALFTALVAVKANNANPIEKIIEMISELEAKIIKEGEDAQKTYEEFSEWCEDSSKNLMFEIKTGKGEVASLKSTIEKESSNIQVQDSKIEELAGGISTDESDLKAATEIRNKEEATFRAEEKDLVETVDILERAIGIIEKEMNGGAAMVQLKQASTVTQVLGMMVQAESLSSADAHKLTALVQTVQRSDDDDSGAPDPAAYENQSGGVIDTMNDLLEKAQTQLDTLRAAEQKNVQNYEMLKQSLDDQIKNAKKEMDEAKTSKAASEEKKATAEGDLDVTSKDLGEDEKALGELHHNCMSTAGGLRSRDLQPRRRAQGARYRQENHQGNHGRCRRAKLLFCADLDVQHQFQGCSLHSAIGKEDPRSCSCTARFSHGVRDPFRFGF